MIVCVCHRVSDRDIARAAREGCASFDELQFELSVATACGRCHECAHETFQHHICQVRQFVAGGAAGDGSTPHAVIPIVQASPCETARAHAG